MNQAHTQDRIGLIRERLAPLAPTQLEVSDESHFHAGHAGTQSGAGHYYILIVSAAFAGLTSVARHRLVYHHLNDLIPFPIHALALDTRAP